MKQSCLTSAQEHENGYSFTRLLVNSLTRFRIKKTILCLAMCIFGMLSANGQTDVWDGSHTAWTRGTGTAGDPYLIESAEQLAHLAYIVNNGIGAGSGRTVGANTYWKLTTDVDLNGSESFQWTPIGYYNSDSDYYNFGGHFDGDNHTIGNLFINTSTLQRIGLFGYTDGGSIKNVGIVGNSSVIRISANSKPYAGGIAGYVKNTSIDNCYNTGVVSSYNSLSSSDAYSGGIAGYSTSNILNCYNTGPVSVPLSSGSSSFSGGIVGHSTSSILNCYNIGAVSASSSYYYHSGGIAGRSTASIINCYNTGAVSAPSYYSGGIAGSCSAASIINCYNIGTISGSLKGGIVGYGTAVVTNSYYLVTCGATGSGQSKTEDFMKTTEFVDLLNVGTFAFKQDVVPLQNGGYPLLTFFEIATFDAGNVTQSKANFKGFLKAGSVNIVSKGFQYRIAGEGNYTNQAVGMATDTLTLLATGLRQNKNYEYQTYAVNAENDTAYGEIKTFTTLPITVTTLAETNKTQTKVTLNGTVVLGDAPAIKGFEYKINTVSNYTRVNVTGNTDNITQNITGLQPDKTYQFRVFAIYANDTLYGTELNFTTLPVTVTTSYATDITRSSAVIHGSVYAGDAVLSSVGFLIMPNTGVEAELADNSFSYTLNDLRAAETVQYRAFAVCGGETVWADGDYMQFTTANFNTGNGGYLIENRDDLILLANLVNGGNRFSGITFLLTNDIVLPENTPNNVLSIGNKETDAPFSGIFNGQNHVIKNVYIDRPNTPYQGFFGYTSDARITNLGLSNITASGRNYTGGLVAYAENTDIRNSYVSGGTLFALSYCGGLVGYQTPGTNSIITGCYNTCEVMGNNYVGGLLGYSNQGTVRNSYVAALVSAQGDAVGAIIGGAQDVLSYYCYFNSEITGQDVAIGDNRISSVPQRSPAAGSAEEGKSSDDMRMSEFVNTLNHGLTAPMWKMDYNPPINNGFPILIWQTDRIVSGIKDIPSGKDIVLYPNPVGESFRIGVSKDFGDFGEFSVCIIDAGGRAVLQQTVQGEESIFVGHLPQGIYLVRVNEKTFKVIRK
ncbi:MAG: T9SS type A sorting domain-containing protein [Dysgonamonadaceae bacterium]|jgi:hypothetical protein|nr:T9SS type A sorting domain-containing protein [Dysgonamonadaceae bacterium]